MFRKNRRLFSWFLFTAILVLPFQNCKGGGFQSASPGAVVLSSVDVVQHPTDDHDTPKVTVAQTSYEPVLADRKYLKKLLTDIFGPKTAAVDTTNTFANAMEHGSPCSVQEDYLVYDATKNTYAANDATEVCSLSSPKLLVAPVNPKSTVTRQALVTKACSDLTTNNTTLTYALSRISSSRVPAPTEENLHALFRLFYRSQPEPHQGLIDALSVMFPADATAVTNEHWRMALYTVCISSYWQVL